VIAQSFNQKDPRAANIELRSRRGPPVALARACSAPQDLSAGMTSGYNRHLMTTSYTQLNLTDVEDAAPENGFGERWEARVAREDLNAEQTGLTHFRLRPGRRSPFAHRHGRAEEVYVILAGTGRVKLDDELHDVAPLDAIRVGPRVSRAFEAGPDGLEFIAFGPHVDGDGEPVQDDWVS
jgi:mannose-6-phosphate isomerase-like protein (cupin superfamily)